MRLAILTLALSTISGFSHAMDVTACGTVVPERDIAVLQADLDCGVLPVGVTLGRGARLELNGHVLSGGQQAVLADFGAGHAWVDGPGAVTGAEVGITTAADGVSGRGAELRLTDVDLHDNDIGAFADRLRLTRVTAERNLHGLASNFGLTGVDVVASDNTHFGVWSAAGKIKIRRLTATNNGWYGAIATQGGRVTLIDSTVSGNAPAYGAIDISSSRRPSLKNVGCGRSSNSYSVFFTGGTSWNVCADD